MLNVAALCIFAAFGSAIDLIACHKEKSAGHMIREFQYRGETFRVNYHGIHGHEEVFIIHMIDGEEWGEISIDRMTEENDTSAPIEDICVVLCDRLIIEREINCAEPDAGFTWVEGNVLVQVHDGVQHHH